MTEALKCEHHVPTFISCVSSYLDVELEERTKQQLQL